jgi:hypothetical protein
MIMRFILAIVCFLMTASAFAKTDDDQKQPEACEKSHIDIEPQKTKNDSSIDERSYSEFPQSQRDTGIDYGGSSSGGYGNPEI